MHNCDCLVEADEFCWLHDNENDRWDMRRNHMRGLLMMGQAKEAVEWWMKVTERT